MSVAEAESTIAEAAHPIGQTETHQHDEHATQHAQPLATPPIPLPSIPAALVRLEHESLVLSSQFHSMIESLQSSQADLSELTLEYIKCMAASVRSSSSSVDILIDTHTSLIRKLLIGLQQTNQIDTLERQVQATKVALTEIERGVEALLAADAIAITRAQLANELKSGAEARIVDELQREGAIDHLHIDGTPLTPIRSGGATPIGSATIASESGLTLPASLPPPTFEPVLPNNATQNSVTQAAAATATPESNIPTNTKPLLPPPPEVEPL